jgi:hypothetical protein
MDNQNPLEYTQDPALNNPKSRLEVSVAELEKAVTVRSEKPGNFLPSNQEELTVLTARWNFPKVYVEFLERFGGANVVVGENMIYGSKNLLEAQSGWAFSSSPDNVIEDWPPEWVVVGQAGEDQHEVFILDLSEGDQDDSPVKYLDAGFPEEDFAPSFQAFLERLLTDIDLSRHDYDDL